MYIYIYILSIFLDEADCNVPASIESIEPNGVKDFIEGQGVGFQFKCKAEGMPPPQVSWSLGIRFFLRFRHILYFMVY